MTYLLLEFVNAGRVCEVGGNDEGLHTVCRCESTGDRLELITASRGQDDIDAPGGDLGGQCFTDPVAGAGDQRPRAVPCTKPLVARMMSFAIRVILHYY
jgi:hypothetical protein